MDLHTRLAACAALALLAASGARAGTIASQTQGAPAEDVIEFNARGDLRLGGGSMPETMGVIARDGRVYFFGEIDGKPAAVDMLAAEKKARAKGMKQEQPPPAETVKDLRAMGRRQAVAGLEGEVFVVTWASAEGSREEEVVLTRDPRLAPVLKTLQALPAMGEKTPAAWFREAVLARGYFPLKSEREQVTRFDPAEVPAERFALKAKPSDDIELVFQMVFGAAFGQLGQALGEATQAIGEGLGAALGGAAEGGADASASTGPAPLAAAQIDAARKIEAQLQRVAKPGGMQLPLPKTDYSEWSLHDGGPLLLHLPPVNGYNLSSGGSSIKVDFEPADMEARVFLEMAYAEGTLPGTALDAAKAGYRSLSQRLGKREIVGFQPLVLDGIAGTLEIYDDPDDDGDRHWRVVKWTGYLEGEGQVSPIECYVALRPEGYAQFAPRIGGILQSLRMPPAE